MKTLVILSHPNLEESIANKTIVEQLETNVDNLEIRHIEKLYPDFKIDVEAEQTALHEADIIIFQHPFYWYSTPAALKQWIDDVLAFGFAFGTNGDKLKGKHFMQSITVGGPKESYAPLGYNHFTVEQFLKPMEQTVYLTGMIYHGFIHTHRNAYIEGTYNSRREVVNTAKGQAERLIAFIEQQRQGDIPKIEAFIAKWFAAFDDLDENTFFTQYLAKDIKMNMPDHEPIENHDGFYSWYNGVQETFERPTKHDVENLKIVLDDKDNHYRVNFDVQVDAVLKSDGSKKTINAHEEWLLEWDTISQRPRIKNYRVRTMGS
ncbi:MAG: NAD(P)H-dependent oxidoreductase [Symploca sp. SIO2G7]|nr:NAD(P)H-dependent oxidoreductase [Symploca sp. SIO2G7]